MSNRVFTASSIEELAELPIHDQWVDIDDIRWDKGGLLTVPVRIGQGMCDDDWTPPPRSAGAFPIRYSYKEPRFRAELSIEQVVRYALHDDAGIGGGDVYAISYEDGAVVIEFCEFVAITAETPHLCVQLAISDVVVDATIVETYWDGVQVTRRANDTA